MSLGRLTAAFTGLLRRRILTAMPVAVRSASPSEAEPSAKRIKLPPELEAPLYRHSPPSIPSSLPPSTADGAASASTPASPPAGKKKKPKQPAKSGAWSIMPTPEQEAASAAACEAEMNEPFELEKKYAYELDYRNKLVLAPMVRSGTLPMRLLALYHGAGLVWTPEIVDKAIIGAERSVDPVTGVITYHKGQGAIWTTHPIEKPFVIFQVGSSDPELAAQAAKIVAQDVSGIDLNCGCPKPFSTHSGMGAALLSTPDLLLSILRSLLRAVDLPISCKIRLLPGQEDTRHLVSRIIRTGIRNLTVHCRTRDMRPRERAIWDRLGDLVKLGERRGINVICNGDGEGYENWAAIKERTGATSAMLARSAETNPSVFRPEGPLDSTSVVIPQFLNVAEYIQNNWGNTKFLLMQFKPSPSPISNMSKQERKDASEAVARSKSQEELAEKMGIEMGKGKAFMDELEAKLRARPEWDIFHASGRAGAVASGEAVATERPAAIETKPAEEAPVESEVQGEERDEVEREQPTPIAATA